MKAKLPVILALSSSTLFKDKSIALLSLLVIGSMMLMMASLCVSTRRTVNGVKRLAPPALTDSCALSKVNMDTPSRTVAPKAATASVELRPNAPPANLAPWREPRVRLMDARLAHLDTIVMKAHQTLS